MLFSSGLNTHSKNSSGHWQHLKTLLQYGFTCCNIDQGKTYSLLGVMEMFYMLIRVMVSGCIHLSKLIKLLSYIECSLLHVNYASV